MKELQIRLLDEYQEKLAQHDYINAPTYAMILKACSEFGLKDKVLDLVEGKDNPLEILFNYIGLDFPMYHEIVKILSI